MFSRLKQKLFSRRERQSDLIRNGFRLPDDVVMAISERRVARLASFVEWACAQENREQILEEIGARAKTENWDAGDLARLDSYCAYFSERFHEAYQLAKPLLEDGKVDAVSFGVASMALYNTNQFDDAYRLLRRFRPHEKEMLEDPEYLLAAILICWSAGDRYLANKYMDLAMRDVVSRGVMTFNSFAVYYELGDEAGFNLSVSYLNAELRAKPNFQYAQAFVDLANDNYEVGLKLAESRYDMPEAHRYLQKDLLLKPRWQGEDIAEKTLLIHGEQGLGDMVQTARFFERALAAAKAVIVDCPYASMALLEHNFPEITFVPLDTTKAIRYPFDIWTGTLSLPYVFKCDSDSIPGRDGYLNIPADHRAYWKSRVAEVARPGSTRIGIAWSGYPGHRGDRRRSVPWPMARTMIMQLPGVDFFSIQIAVPEDAPANLYNCSEEMATLSDTAALIEQMDLVISVDTSVVHIAGAIGKETWMMLPYRYEWRWGMEGEDNNWYDSVKVIRQPSPGAWAPVLSRVFGRRLRDFIELRTGKTHA